MEEKIPPGDITETIETAIDINSLASETKSDIFSRTKKHRETITRIILSQYSPNDNYVVTYSEEDNSFLGWTISEW